MSPSQTSRVKQGEAMNARLTKLVRRLLFLPQPSPSRMVRRLHWLYGLRLELVAELLDYRPDGQHPQVFVTTWVESWLKRPATPADTAAYGPILAEILKIVSILDPDHCLDGPKLEDRLLRRQRNEYGCTANLLELIQTHNWSAAKRTARRMAPSRTEPSPAAS